MSGEHVHVWIHVGTMRNGIACKCTCGRSLSPSQILSMREFAGAES